MLDLEFNNLSDEIRKINITAKQDAKRKITEKRKHHRERCAREHDKKAQLGIAIGVMATRAGARCFDGTFSTKALSGPDGLGIAGVNAAAGSDGDVDMGDSELTLTVEYVERIMRGWCFGKHSANTPLLRRAYDKILRLSNGQKHFANCLQIMSARQTVSRALRNTILPAAASDSDAPALDDLLNQMGTDDG